MGWFEGRTVYRLVVEFVEFILSRRCGVERSEISPSRMST